MFAYKVFTLIRIFLSNIFKFYISKIFIRTKSFKSIAYFIIAIFAFILSFNIIMLNNIRIIRLFIYFML